MFILYLLHCTIHIIQIIRKLKLYNNNIMQLYFIVVESNHDLIIPFKKKFIHQMNQLVEVE